MDYTLWAEHADQKMNTYLIDNGYDKLVIIILQLCKPKIVNVSDSFLDRLYFLYLYYL